MSWRLPVWARLLLAPLLLLGVLWAVDLATVAVQLRSTRSDWLLASLACAVASNGVAAWRWARLLGWLGHGIGLARAAVLCWQAVALNALLPGAVVGGDLWRIAALRRRGLALGEASLSVLLDRLSGLWMVGVAGLFAAAWGLAQQDSAGHALRALRLPATAAPTALGLALLLLLGPAGLLWWGRHRGRGHSASPPHGVQHGVQLKATLAAPRPAAQPALVQVPHPAQHPASHPPVHQAPHPSSNPALHPMPGRFAGLLLRPRAASAYGQQAVASAAVHLLSVAALACAARALGLDLPYWAFVVAAVPIFLMATLPISFGGWGTREAAAGLALAVFGVPPASGVAVALTVGVLGLVQAAAGAVLLALERGRS